MNKRMLNKNICTKENKFDNNHVHGCKFHPIQFKKLDINTTTYLNCVHVSTKKFAMSSSFDEAKALAHIYIYIYMKGGPRQENMPTKLGSWWNFGTCESQKGWTCCKPWHNRWYKQVWNCYYKMEQDFNIGDECKFFNSTAKWRYI